MNLTRTKIASTIIIFLLCFLTHFGYDVFKNSITSIFFPVNESIWEHMKMLYTAIILNGLIEFLIIKKFKVKSNNFLLSLFVSSAISIPIFLVLYLPFYYKIGPKMFLNIAILLLTIILVEIVAYYIQKRNNIKLNNIVPIILIIIIYVVFGYLTYHPIENEIFFDKMNEKYGLNIYRLSN